MDRNILAGMFACSNLGHRLDPHRVEEALREPPESATAAAYHFLAEYMEDEHHEDVMVEEAVGWHDKLVGMSDEEITKMWPQTVVVYRAAEAEVPAVQG